MKEDDKDTALALCTALYVIYWCGTFIFMRALASYLWLARLGFAARWRVTIMTVPVDDEIMIDIR